MKKHLIIFLISVGILLAPVTVTKAQVDLSQDIAAKSGYKAGVTEGTLSETVGKIIKAVLGLLGTVFLALTVYAGVLWMTAAGEEEKVTKATGILKTSVIGLIIILAAYSITYFVLSNLFRVTS